MPLPIGFSYVTGSLSDSYAAFAITEDSTNESNSRKVPSKCLIDKVRVTLSSISSATSISWYLSEDSAGKYAITPVTSTTINTGLAASTFGFYSASMDNYPFLESSNITTSGTLYFVAKVDDSSGTASFESFLHWRRA